MHTPTLLRRLRGLLGNAIVWSICWSVACLTVYGILALLGNEMPWSGIWRNAARVGVVGGLASTVFSIGIGLFYRGRRLRDISWLRFGLSGGIVAGLFLPTLMLVGRTINGDGPLPLTKYLSSALVATLFGAVAASLTMYLAQRGEPAAAEDDMPAALGSGDLLGDGAPGAPVRESVPRRDA